MASSSLNSKEESTRLLEALRPLLLPLETLQEVKGTRIKLFKKLLGGRVIDALLHLPSGVQHYHPISAISQAKEGETVIIRAQIMEHIPSPSFKGPYRIKCYDGKGFFELQYFRGHAGYLKKILPSQGYRVIIGKADQYNNRWRICHPERILVEGAEKTLPTHQVIYPLTTGITSPCVSRVITNALSRLPRIPDWLSSDLTKHYHWPNWTQALNYVHNPTTVESLSPLPGSARERLMFDELLAHQLAIQLIRRHGFQEEKGCHQKGTGKLITALRELLPYSPTNAQERVINEIFDDMASAKPMSRLVQGDVGSGKTLVALMALLKTVEAGFQGAILAPTDILARQHAETMIPLLSRLGIRSQVLTGRDTGKKAQALRDQVADGTIQILIGTHALLEDKVTFHRLGLAVIDEQHRFGVKQRLKLCEKGSTPDVLAMTATPIPRTLRLTQFGDMDVSIIDEKPPGRQAVKTTVLPTSKLPAVIEGLERLIQQKNKIFWVCPLVEESEALDLTAAEERYKVLQHVFGQKVGLIHGKMKASLKDAVMEKFLGEEVDILVSTTVIEVGVNVPAATVMIIEQAERFGLAQLHQLRGRVGRGLQEANCVLLYKPPLSPIAQQRLEIMRETEDGFRIAEADLQLRGSGDVLGTRQSGLPLFRVVDFVSNPQRSQELLSLANKEAKRICSENPFLEGNSGLLLRFLLTLFDKEDAIKYIRS